MKGWLLAATAVVSLAACKVKDEATPPAPSPTVGPAAEATSNGAPGTYELTAKDGTKSTATLMADGSYMDRDAKGKQTEKGTWKAAGDMKTCFTADKAGSKPVCYTETKPDANGMFTATPDEGSGAITVKKAA